MKKIIQTLALSFLVGGVITSKAQVQPCNTFDAMDNVFANDPAAKVRYDQEQEKLQKAYKDYENSLKLNKTAAVQFTVPVVFHILHLNGPENISDASCINALAQINSDYAKMGADVGTINSNFASLYIPADIKFMLAHKDPSGNCTSGIVHHYDVNTDWAQNNYSNYAYTGSGAGKWPPTQYLNIYIVRQICPTTPTCSTSGGIVVGYTYKPGTWSTNASQDAIVYNYQYLSGLNARSLSHEIGHWLNLSHTFGNTNNPGVTCGDDGLADTPPTKGYFSTCPGNNAGPYTGCAAIENIENFMDYSSCPKMFSTDQVNTMRTAVQAATSGRSNLITPANLTATDVNGTTTCQPIASLYAQSGAAVNIYTVCSGGSLTFVDNSYNGTVTTRSWVATGGGAITTTTGTPTSITFPSVGTETVTLTVGNANGTTTATKIIQVLNGVPNVSGTYQESFENTGLPTNWLITNQTGGTTWQQYFGAAATGNNSYYMNNQINPNGAIDMIRTPSYDFVNNSGATFTFKYAYARYNSTFADVFKIQASSNCGASWTDIYTIPPATMASGSGGTTTTPFTPTPTQFKTYTLTSHPAFNPFKLQPNVYIRFYFQEDPTTGFGNNLYLDDINFNLPLGVNELSQSIRFNLYPNPSTGAANIEFVLSDNSDINYSVCDLVGRIVEPLKSYKLEPGSHMFTVNENSSLKPGVYFVNFQINGQKISRKFIVE